MVIYSEGGDKIKRVAEYKDWVFESHITRFLNIRLLNSIIMKYIMWV